MEQHEDNFDRYLVNPRSTLRLADRETSTKGGYKKKQARKMVRAYSQRLRELQYLLYAEGARSLLICLQAMDAGGKDGTIRHVLGCMNPQGCRVQAFKVPTPTEAAHDFLWRIHHVTPAKGEVVIFNRSHYEDVLVTRVHGLIQEKDLEPRFRAINQFEQHLAAHGTAILKFFLHISPEEQLERFRKRLEDPTRQWKISVSDYSERKLWNNYQRAYEDALSQCSLENAPWYVIPADRKWYRNLVISQVLVNKLESLQLQTPAPTVDLNDIRRQYHAAMRTQS